MNEPTRLNIPEWTVSELSAALKKTVEDAFGYVRVRGEISGYRGPQASGHCYFALKDEGAKIEAVIFRSAFARMRLKPEEGLEVFVTGRLTTYPGRSKYQIVIETLEPAGLGALMALLEERKKKLATEGLFDAARKQLLPFLPERIGVVTSPTGAVIRDILHRLADRFPRHVLVWPVKVQGEDAAEQVAAAIRGFNALLEVGPVPRPHLLIVARGGGSLEDLWAFNEEIVARAAAASLIPLISAAGHEADVTLIDFAADRRAPTPTAAAEMAVPVRAELIAQIAGLGQRHVTGWARGMETLRKELRAAMRLLPTAETLLAEPRQRLDAATDRLPRALKANAQIHHTQFSRVAARLSPAPLRVQSGRCREKVSAFGERAQRAVDVLRHRRRERFSGLSTRLAVALRANMEAQRSHIARSRERTQALAERAGRAARTIILHKAAMLDRAGGLLDALSYRGVLARGFALVRDARRRPLRSATEVSPGLALEIEFADGRVGARAEGAPTTFAPPRMAKPRKRGGGDRSEEHTSEL